MDVKTIFAVLYAWRAVQDKSP